MARYGMTIDMKRCIGCQTCAVLCKSANNLPNDIWWNHVYTEGGASVDTAGGTYENPVFGFRPVACQHCENPACVEVCPAGATYKDSETGIVCQDTEVCIGCQACIAACPYGVRTFIESEPQYYLSFPVGDADAPQHRALTVEKCTFCGNRVAAGKEPACVTMCPARARLFGDLDDPESSVSKLVASRETETLLPEMGTNPSVYYLV